MQTSSDQQPQDVPNEEVPTPSGGSSISRYLPLYQRSPHLPAISTPPPTRSVHGVAVTTSFVSGADLGSESAAESELDVNGARKRQRGIRATPRKSRSTGLVAHHVAGPSGQSGTLSSSGHDGTSAGTSGMTGTIGTNGTQLMDMESPSIPLKGSVSVKVAANGSASFPDLSLRLLDLPSLRVVLASHRVVRGKARNRADLIALALSHRCTSLCSMVRYDVSDSEPKVGGTSGAVSDGSGQATSQKYIETLLQEKLMANFPPNVTSQKKRSVISRWIDALGNTKMSMTVCAVCSERMLASQTLICRPNESQFRLLADETLPSTSRPTGYDSERVFGAILNPKGIHYAPPVLDVLPELTVCKSCWRSLSSNSMPPLALANRNYMGRSHVPAHIQALFDKATSVELSLISRYRVRCTIHKFSCKQGSPQYGGPDVLSQRFMTGNTITFANECSGLLNVLPPSPDIIGDTICVLFVGTVYPSPEEISRMTPLLARRWLVYELLTWLKENNPDYFDIEISQDNLNNLLPSDEPSLPIGIAIQHLPSEPVDAESSGYANPAAHPPPGASAPIPMHSHGVLAVSIEGLTVKEMKALAIKHWKSGGKAWTIPHGSSPISEYDNPTLFPRMFPHLFPFGFGGLEDPMRKEKISMQAHVKHLLNLDDFRFQTDQNFAFVAMNILQRRESSRSVRFKVKRSAYTRTAELLCSAELSACDTLISRSKDNGGHVIPQTDEERVITEIMDKVNIASSSIPGSSATKVNMRNQIRALMHWLGSPTFFITINPADVFSPLFCHLAGCIVDLDSTHPDLPPEFERRLLLARNPAAGARFFNLIMQTFIDVVLDMNSEDGGLFGKISGYYGTIEAQGRGSLHCHMMIWVEGSLGPQALRDSLKCEAFQTALFQYLEDTIKGQLPTDNAPVPEGMTDCPERPDDEPHPCTLRCPRPDDPDFEKEWAAQLLRTVLDCNYHVHTETCWKYLKPGEPRDHKHCRMRIDGTTVDKTDLDEETGSILLRHFHPFINNYNEVLIMLAKCNMDIKFIGSGEGAKALIYYITDYITKTALPTHVAFAALQLVIDKLKTPTDGQPSTAESADLESLGRLTLVKACNALLGNQELSGQQVNLHLLGLANGKGDHYTSHSFETLHWAAVKGWVKAHHQVDPTLCDPEIPADTSGSDANDPQSEPCPDPHEPEYNIAPSDPSEMSVVLPEDEEVSLSLDPTFTTVPECSPSIVDDYRLRGNELEDVSLYWFVAMTQKITHASEAARLGKRKRGAPSSGSDQALPRVRFLESHPQSETHLLRVRESLLVPVLLGPTIGRSDREPEKHALDMLLLFKPWRRLEELRSDQTTWAAAFDLAKPSLSTKSLGVISNMSHLHECRDARDKYSLLRRSGVLKGNLIDDSLLTSTGTSTQGIAGNQDENELLHIIRGMGLESSHLDADGGDHGSGLEVQSVSWKDQLASSAVQQALRTGIHAKPLDSDAITTDSAVAQSSSDKTALDQLRKSLQEYKTAIESDGMPDPAPSSGAHAVAMTYNEASMQGGTSSLTYEHNDGPRSREELQKLVRTVAGKYHLNKEQERAFGIVAQHKVLGDPSQLLLVVAGPGGTGKSQVIAALSSLFAELNDTARLRKVAPTGIASYAIGGTTVHSLLNLCSEKFSKRMLEKAQTRLAGVTHIIVDEFSMLGAKLASKLSTRLGQVSGSTLPFGGFHMMFCGDVAQLPPVGDTALWSGYHPSATLQREVAVTAAPKKKGQLETHGRGLWRCIQNVVVLKENHRAKGDPVFTALLNRLRAGKGTTVDWLALLSRKLDSALVNADEWADAPLVTADKALRDKWNEGAVASFASRTKQTVETYVSVDEITGQPSMSEKLQRVLHHLPSSAATRDRLGRLPLVTGMRVMVLHNVLTQAGVVNGAEGILKRIVYKQVGNSRVAVVAHVKVEGSVARFPGLEEGVVPIFPDTTPIKLQTKQLKTLSIKRTQLPLMPAYAFTDFKSQARTLPRAVIDLDSATRSLESAYVMVSRGTSLENILILRPFPIKRINRPQTLATELELKRLLRLDDETTTRYELHEMVRTQASTEMMALD